MMGTHGIPTIGGWAPNGCTFGPPRTHRKIKVLSPQNMGEITPKMKVVGSHGNPYLQAIKFGHLEGVP